MGVAILFILSIISRNEYKKIVKHISDISCSLGLTCCLKALLDDENVLMSKLWLGCFKCKTYILLLFVEN